jgi:hypothetical protein
MDGWTDGRTDRQIGLQVLHEFDKELAEPYYLLFSCMSGVKPTQSVRRTEMCVLNQSGA